MPKIGQLQASPWRQTRVAITVNVWITQTDGASGEKYVVDAQVNGPFAVHRKVGKDATVRQWVLTSIPTGYIVTSLESEDDCKRIAEILLTECRPAWTASDLEELKNLVPDWIVKWCLACRVAGRVLDSETYKGGTR